MFLLLWRNADGQRCRECASVPLCVCVSVCVWEHMSPTVHRCILHFDCFICCFRLTVTTREGVASVFWLDSCCFSLPFLLSIPFVLFRLFFTAISFKFSARLWWQLGTLGSICGPSRRFLQDVPHLCELTAWGSRCRSLRDQLSRKKLIFLLTD